jgi:hypothetical protein
VFGGGDPLTVIETPEFDVVPPGETLDVSVRLRVPVDAGVYTSQWQLLPPGEREPIGGAATLVIEVEE